jgi:hypothetical protein
MSPRDCPDPSQGSMPPPCEIRSQPHAAPCKNQTLQRPIVINDETICTQRRLNHPSPKLTISQSSWLVMLAAWVIPLRRPALSHHAGLARPKPDPGIVNLPQIWGTAASLVGIPNFVLSTSHSARRLEAACVLPPRSSLRAPTSGSASSADISHIYVGDASARNAGRG